MLFVSYGSNRSEPWSGSKRKADTQLNSHQSGLGFHDHVPALPSNDRASGKLNEIEDRIKVVNSLLVRAENMERRMRDRIEEMRALEVDFNSGRIYADEYLKRRLGLLDEVKEMGSETDR